MAAQGDNFRYFIGAGAFLTRARESLGRFDEDEDVSALFTAALQLRFGIEARLTQYLDATLQSLGRSSARVTEYSAKDLLHRLMVEDPRANAPTSLFIVGEQESGTSFRVDYTPVTPELARIHGRLGQLLHYSFFRGRPGWFLKRRTHGEGTATLLDARALIAVGIDGLAAATRGRLLTHPSFTVFLQGLEGEEEANPH